MRLSPVLVAVFTASATFGLSNSANGQTAYSESESSLSSKEAFEPINSSLNQSETHAKPSLDVNQSIPSTPINSFEGIVLNKTKSPYSDLAFSLGQSTGNQVSYAWVNTSYSQNLPEFNPSQTLINSAVDSSLNPTESEVLPENYISLNKGKNTEDLEKLEQVSTEVSSEIAIAEINNFSNLGIILNKAETEKVGNFSFPVLTEEAIALNSNLPESDLFQPSLHKDSEKIAQFPTPVPEKIASAEINNFSNLGIILNKA
ncbi:hypothetical protein [Planktothrix agardhii]|uniref:hypothetical protein n=1 Tax=Planktothrix agardhii TaxID=1160 RepID=UPI001D0A6501|nr:hypothetical protein [Planktothrix agardhii]MCB8780959.1 hypothetical protein [Planktothrix agardhii 1808]